MRSNGTSALQLVSSNRKPQQATVDPAGHYVVAYLGNLGATYVKHLGEEGHQFPTKSWPVTGGLMCIYKMPEGYHLAANAGDCDGPGDGVFVREATAEDMQRDGWAVNMPQFLIQRDRKTIQEKWQRTEEAEKAAAPPKEEQGSIVMHSWILEMNKKQDHRQCITMDLDGDALRAYYSNGEIVKKVMACLGFPFNEIGESSNCILPGHTEHDGAMWRGNNGVYVYRCFGEQRFYTLPDVYASMAYRRVKGCSKVESSIWGIRLLVEAGILTPANVDAVPISNASEPLQRVYRGFLLLLGCKWLYKGGYGQPAAFSWPFVMAWCGVTERQAKDSIASLKGRGLIVEAQKIPGKYGKATTLWLPGTQELVDQRFAEWKAKR